MTLESKKDGGFDGNTTPFKTEPTNRIIVAVFWLLQELLLRGVVNMQALRSIDEILNKLYRPAYESLVNEVVQREQQVEK